MLAELELKSSDLGVLAAQGVEMGLLAEGISEGHGGHLMGRRSDRASQNAIDLKVYNFPQRITQWARTQQPEKEVLIPVHYVSQHRFAARDDNEFTCWRSSVFFFLTSSLSRLKDSITSSAACTIGCVSGGVNADKSGF